MTDTNDSTALKEDVVAKPQQTDEATPPDVVKSKRSLKPFFAISIVIIIALGIAVYLAESQDTYNLPGNAPTQPIPTNDPSLFVTPDITPNQQKNDNLLPADVLQTNTTEALAQLTTPAAHQSPALATQGSPYYQIKNTIANIGIGNGRPPQPTEKNTFVTHDDLIAYTLKTKTLHQELIDYVTNTNDKLTALESKVTSLNSKVIIADALSNKAIDITANAKSTQSERIALLQQQIEQIIKPPARDKNYIDDGRITSTNPLRVPFQLFSIEQDNKQSVHAVCTPNDKAKDMFTISQGEEYEGWVFESIDPNTTQIRLKHRPSGTTTIINGS
jgi:hypothetical protein